MEDIVKILSALANSNRLRIVSVLLFFNELCVCYLKKPLGIAGATVSRHLSILQNAGILKARRSGKWIYYSLSEEFKKEEKLMCWLRNRLKQNKQYKEDILNIKKEMDQNPSC